MADSPTETVLLKAIDASLLFTKNDKNDVRLGDLARASKNISNVARLKKALHEVSGDLKSDDVFTLIGYPDDEGICLGGGRPGAKEAPERLRSYFYKMTPPANQKTSDRLSVFDVGNLDMASAVSIEKRHENARQIAREIHSAGFKTVTFGGGHDYGFPDAAAFAETILAQGERPLVINFDAHLDVRPLDRGFTSGTPFFRLLKEFPNIDFVELGLQKQCNSKSHLDWLIAQGGQFSFEEDRATSNLTLTQTLLKLLGDKALSRRKVFLSVDIDGFSSSVAPGASQSWPTGFMPHEFFETFNWCLSRFDVRGVGIYEVSPPLDIDDRTSRLGALIAHRFVFQSA